MENVQINFLLSQHSFIYSHFRLPPFLGQNFFGFFIATTKCFQQPLKVAKEPVGSQLEVTKLDQSCCSSSRPEMLSRCSRPTRGSLHLWPLLPRLDSLRPCQEVNCFFFCSPNDRGKLFVINTFDWIDYCLIYLPLAILVCKVRLFRLIDLVK